MILKFIGLMLFILPITSFGGPLRVILPSEADLSGYEIQEGELVYGGSGLKIAMPAGNSNQFMDLSLREILPNTYKIATDGIVIGSGTVFFGQKVLEWGSPISCSYSTFGLGGYETGSNGPSTPQIMHLYLVYDAETNPSAPQINCIISSSSSGPFSVSVPWRRLYSFWTGANFTSVGEKVFYTTGTDMTFSTTSPSACTSISLPRISPETQRAKLKLTCNTAGSTNYSVYTESTCTAPLAVIASCSSTATLPSFIEMSPNQPLYYKGVVGSIQLLNIIEINELKKMSN